MRARHNVDDRPSRGPDGRVLQVSGPAGFIAASGWQWVGGAPWRGRSRRHIVGLLLIVAALPIVAPVGVDAQEGSEGTWVETTALDACTGDGCQGRSEAVAGWLPTTGQVLLAAGGDSGDTAQRYNPADETWEDTASLPETVSQPANVSLPAVLLQDGEVLISHLRYHAGTDSWTESQAIQDDGLPVVRARLEDGTVLGSGGPSNVLGVHSTEAKRYDPGEERVDAVAEMVNPRAYHAAVRLGATQLDEGDVQLTDDTHKGKVLVTGGQQDRNTYASQQSAELYDPATNAWTPITPMLASRRTHAAVKLNDGRVMVVGGSSCPPGVGSTSCREPDPQAEIYDPITGAWIPTDPIPLYVGPSMTPPTAVLADGRVLVVGHDRSSWGTSAAAVYDPTSNTWTETPSMVHPDRHPATVSAALIDDSHALFSGDCGDLCGGVLVAGGDGAETAAEVFLPSQ